MQLYFREKYLKRIRGFYHDDQIIKVITGVRRCGKSCLLEMIKKELLDSGVPAESVISINLDSRKYKKIKIADQLEELIDSLLKDYDMTYLFIDEIQNVDGFEEVVNAFREDGGYSIFVTGSNSYLLSGELVTKLTGRYIEFEMYPLTFDEYIEMKTFLGKPVSSNLNEEMSQYLYEGGFPETLQYETAQDKRTYVGAVIDEIFEKDIKRRVKVRNVEGYERVRDFVINNFGATMSINSLQGALEKIGLKMDRRTICRYIEALVQSKVLYRCDRFDMKSKRSLSGEKKYYLADTSFYFARSTDNRINYGPALENMVYIYAKSLNYSVSIGRIGKLECDFILRDQELNYSYVQVAYTINENRQTEDREYASLENIADNYPKYVATTDYLLQKRNGIKHINLLEFMKDKNRF